MTAHQVRYMVEAAGEASGWVQPYGWQDWATESQAAREAGKLDPALYSRAKVVKVTTVREVVSVIPVTGA